MGVGCSKGVLSLDREWVVILILIMVLNYNCRLMPWGIGPIVIVIGIVSGRHVVGRRRSSIVGMSVGGGLRVGGWRKEEGRVPVDAR